MSKERWFQLSAWAPSGGCELTLAAESLQLNILQTVVSSFHYTHAAFCVHVPRLCVHFLS